MENDKVIRGKLISYIPTSWEQLPDLGLYMDQVITYTERQCRPLYPEKESILTPAMINNYVKCGLVKRPNGKKYDRIHMAQLMMLTTLKQAASVEEMKQLMTPRDGQTIEELYASFCGMQADVFRYLSERPRDSSAMQYAIEAAAFRILCTQLLVSEKFEVQSQTGKKEEPAGLV